MFKFKGIHTTHILILTEWDSTSLTVREWGGYVLNLKGDFFIYITHVQA